MLPLDETAYPPPVWKWYRVYAGLMAAMYVLFTAFMVVFGALEATHPGRQRGPAIAAWVYLVVIVGGSALLAAAYAAAFFLPFKPWAWIYHIVLIGIGMTSVCCLPACIPLLIYWFSPETKRFFGRA
jgi:hypothetical protein